MLKKYSYWETPDLDNHFQPGVELYDFHKDQGFVLKFVIQAETWEEALAIHHLRKGWAYTPTPKDFCPKCNFVVYGSGECYCDSGGKDGND